MGNKNSKAENSKRNNNKKNTKNKKNNKESSKTHRSRSNSPSKGRAQEEKMLGSLSGIATLRREGDVMVKDEDNHKIVVSEFSVGPLQLEVSKVYGKGKARMVEVDRFNSYIDAIYRRMNAALRAKMM